MDSSSYKRFTVSRGFEYSYYVRPAAPGKLTLLFVHGFPSFATDWRLQVAFFEQKGYGLIVPDMLGFGGTSKPTDPTAYVASLLAKDLVEIVDAEAVADVVAIGHDWGSYVVSRVANHSQDRFRGFSFLAVGYAPPTGVTVGQLREMTQKGLGYETLGYWEFFSAPEAPEIIKKHIDSFFDLLWAKDGRVWRYNLGPTGSLQNFLESDSRTPRVEAISTEDYAESQKRLVEQGFEAPLCYYKAMTADLNSANDKTIPQDKLFVTKPVLYLGAAHDAVAPPAIVRKSLELCPNHVSKVLDTGHWIMLEAADEVNAQIEAWLQTIA
ncbi:alpha/beta-hydrolase [Coprinopsis marcescibilis]|uniref:Alpha/beta-hydrolase n=1 Tax=Coprinopsis marcescibilis TaxID=230819 RepID=A0A5C3LF40_COPMA|nr:alpha/beta-hydrolase [Coprinopsis marcescibilis]